MSLPVCNLSNSAFVLFIRDIDLWSDVPGLIHDSGCWTWANCDYGFRILCKICLEVSPIQKTKIVAAVQELMLMEWYWCLFCPFQFQIPNSKYLILIFICRFLKWCEERVRTVIIFINFLSASWIFSCYWNSNPFLLKSYSSHNSKFLLGKRFF